jgi:hypothetical protein
MTDFTSEQIDPKPEDPQDLILPDTAQFKVSGKHQQDDEVVRLEVGHFRTKIRKTGKYYYWQYYLVSGKKFDRYLGTNRDRAIEKAKFTGYPPDASRKYQYRNKKSQHAQETPQL